MNYAQVVKHFGSEANAARELNLHRQTVNKWKKRIPIDRQMAIEVATGGVLRASVPDEIRESAA